MSAMKTVALAQMESEPEAEPVAAERVAPRCSERTLGVRLFYAGEPISACTTYAMRQAWWDCFDMECAAEFSAHKGAA